MVGSLEELNRIITEIKVKRNIISVYDNDFVSKKKLFAEILERLNDTQILRVKELEELEKTDITISLGSLLAELSYLSGISLYDISVKIDTRISFSGKRSMKEMLELYSKTSLKETSSMQIRIKDTSAKNSFNYIIYFPINMNELQADFKPLVDHLNVSNYTVFNGYEYTHLVYCGDIVCLNCHFTIKDLELEDKVGIWYPSNLIKEAIINCIDRKDNHKNVMDKVKERKRY